MSSMPKTSNRSRIKPTWQPSADDRLYAEERGLPVEDTADAFRDYHMAHGTLMADWAAAWRTWARNQVKFAGRRGDRQLPLLAIASAPDPADPYGAKAWVRTLPDAKPDRMPDGSVVMCVAGYDAAATAVDCCQAVSLQPTWRGDLTLIAEWLRSGVTPDAIVDALSTSRRPNRPDAWRFYDARVRGRRAA